MQLINHVRKFTRLSSLLSTALLLASAFASSQVYAATIASNGAGGGDWAATTTWAGGVIPVVGDNVIITDGDTVTISTFLNITNITLGTNSPSSATLTLQSGGYLRVNGNIDVASNMATWTQPTAGTVEFNNHLGRVVKCRY